MEKNILLIEFIANFCNNIFYVIYSLMIMVIIFRF